MKVIDTDGHVEEWSETFSDPYLDAEFHARRPQVIGSENGRAYWLIEDSLYPRLDGKGCHTLGTPTGFGNARSEIDAWKPEDVESIELRTPEARIAAMKTEGIDMQIIYPTLFIVPPLSQDPSFASALARSYNSWIAEKCRPRSDALKWVATVCLDDIGEAVLELRRSRKLGAVGVMITGTVGERNLDEAVFRPFWAAAEDLDMTVAVHVGWSMPAINNMCSTLFHSSTISLALPLLMGFFSIVGGGILDEFPKLRVGFFELGCEWAPFLTARMDHFHTTLLARKPAERAPTCKRTPTEYWKTGQLFLTCEVDDALLPHVLEMVGEEHILFASDMPHGDRELHAAKILKDRSDISERAKQLILQDNAARFYAL